MALCFVMSIIALAISVYSLLIAWKSYKTSMFTLGILNDLVTTLLGEDGDNDEQNG